MSNESGLKPAGRAVLVEPYAPELKSGVIVIPDSILDRDQMIESRATVIAVGSEAWCDERQPRAVVGDKVLVSKFAGFIAKGTKDDKTYRFINDRDIFAIIEDES